METNIIVENIKCGGCAKTVSNKLKGLFGVENVAVYVAEGRVEVTHSQEVTEAEIEKLLKSLGYPRVNTLHGISAVTTSAKSYVSCMIGKMS